jgi:hypothetical protein
MLTRVVRVFSDHDWARLVVERVHLVVVDRLCLYLGDEHERVAVNYPVVDIYVLYQGNMGTHILESHGPSHALSFHSCA